MSRRSWANKATFHPTDGATEMQENRQRQQGEERREAKARDWSRQNGDMAGCRSWERK
jgi:hypothetical protein